MNFSFNLLPLPPNQPNDDENKTEFILLRVIFADRIFIGCLVVALFVAGKFFK